MAFDTEVYIHLGRTGGVRGTISDKDLDDLVKLWDKDKDEVYDLEVMVDDGVWNIKFKTSDINRIDHREVVP